MGGCLLRDGFEVGFEVDGPGGGDDFGVGLRVDDVLDRWDIVSSGLRRGRGRGTVFREHDHSNHHNDCRETPTKRQMLAK